jgi:hypothetical protein
MYHHVMLAVRQAGEVGEMFEAQRGVKQGDPLSPLLFGLLIDRLEPRLRTKFPNIGARLLDTLVSLLLFADDLVLMAESPEELQTLLDELHLFCIEHGLTVNVRKSEALTLNLRPPNLPPTVLYNNQPLPTSTSFLYLGMLIDSSKGIKDAWQRNLEKGTRASHLVSRRCNLLNIHTPSTRILFFNALAAPIVNYGCEVWAPLALTKINKKNSPRALADRLQLAFLKHALGLPPQAPTPSLWMELSFTRLSCAWLDRIINFHNKALARTHPSDLLKLALTENKKLAAAGVKCWSYHLDKVLREEAAFPHSLSLERIDASAMTTAYESKWSNAQLAPSSRLPANLSVREMPDARSTGFKVFKYVRWFMPDCPPKDRFWHHTHSRHLKRVLSRFRLSMHSLNCEAGRLVNNHKIPRSARTCPLCQPAAIEDEWHLFNCPAYQHIRTAYPSLFLHLEITESSPDSLINQAMNPPACHWRQLGAYISLCFKERARLLNP